LISWNRVTNEIRSGQLGPVAGFEDWLIKFDGVEGRGLGAPNGSGQLEFAYSEMAKSAGVEMAECVLFEEGGRSHFFTRRFDRDGIRKLHVQSFGALWHLDHHLSGIHTYELALNTVRRLGMDAVAVEQMFRRMLFNVVACNQDDHVKNIAFLMDPDENEWGLAPAFDLTHVKVPAGHLRAGHAMTMNGKSDQFTLDDVFQCGATIEMQRNRPKKVLDEVVEAVREWPEFARASGVPEEVAAAVAQDHKVDW
jgi:serine/threonine-protein kinase HipA